MCIVYDMCLFNVQCVHCSLGEIKKQQLNELNLTLPHTEQVASLARPLYVIKIIDFQKVSLNLNLIFKESSNTELIMNIITIGTRI